MSFSRLRLAVLNLSDQFRINRRSFSESDTNIRAHLYQLPFAKPLLDAPNRLPKQSVSIFNVSMKKLHGPNVLIAIEISPQAFLDPSPLTVHLTNKEASLSERASNLAEFVNFLAERPEPTWGRQNRPTKIVTVGHVQGLHQVAVQGALEGRQLPCPLPQGGVEAERHPHRPAGRLTLSPSALDTCERKRDDNGSQRAGGSPRVPPNLTSIVSKIHARTDPIPKAHLSLPPKVSLRSPKPISAVVASVSLANIKPPRDLRTQLLTGDK